MFFPAGTAPDIVSRMNAEIVKAIKTKEVSDFMSKEGATPVGSTPDELSAQLRAEIERYAKVIKAANIKTE
jgi:tripartite-type tricarboxylate transporter receptor subunit TctC